MNEQSTIPCAICGTPTTYTGTKRCNNCWEVEHRLADYLKSPIAQEIVRDRLPLLDDWVDGKPDAWDYEEVLRENEVEVVWCDTLVDDCGNGSPAGVGRLGHPQRSPSKTIARRAAALFVSLRPTS